MRRTFKSAIGWIMIIPLGLLLAAIGLALFFEPDKWPALLILVPLLLFFIHLVRNTDYTIDGGLLRIRCGIFRFQTIGISSITRITETRNPLSSPALSLDRLDIRYGNRGQVMISPKEKDAFIAAIREVNPDADIRVKKPVL